MKKEKKMKMRLKSADNFEKQIFSRTNFTSKKMNWNTACLLKVCISTALAFELGHQQYRKPGKEWGILSGIITMVVF